MAPKPNNSKDAFSLASRFSASQFTTMIHLLITTTTNRRDGDEVLCLKQESPFIISKECSNNKSKMIT